jgi:hypothetical protein
MQPPYTVHRNIENKPLYIGIPIFWLAAVLIFSMPTAWAADKPAAPTTAQGPTQLQGSVTVSVPNAFVGSFNDLVESAEKQNDDFNRYDSAVNRYNTVGSKVAARTVDALNYTLMFKGISPSSEAGDVVLDEKSKIKGLASAKYMRQKLHDEIQLQVVSDVMQLAMAIGEGDQDGSSLHLEQGREQLTKLVGKEQAEKTIAQLKTMRDHEALQAKTASKPIWTVVGTQKRIRAAVEVAAANDSLVKEITGDVHRYNQHGGAILIGHRLVRVALSTVSLAPDFVGPAAQALLFGYLAISGGTEQEKLLRELYLDKRLSSRARLLTEEAHLAFENYQLAALTNNKLLMACSEQLVTRMTNVDSALKLLGSGDISETNKKD